MGEPTFYYDSPREGLATVGVKRERLSKVKKNGDQFRHRYFFSKHADREHMRQRSSHVERISDHHTLSGKVPRLDADCKQIAMRDDVLVFTYKASTPN